MDREQGQAGNYSDMRTNYSSLEKATMSSTLRLSTINILHNPDRMPRRYELLAGYVREQGIEVLCVQEVTDLAGLGQELSDVLPYVAATPVDANGVWGKPTEHVVVLSKYPISRVTHVTLAEGARPAVAADINTPYGNVHALSAHFVWGVHREADRLESARLVDVYAEDYSARNPGVPVVFAGDLNMDDDNVTARFFRGRDLAGDRSTCWVDAWCAAGDNENWATSDHATNPYGNTTAKGVGITHPEYLPARRIDYILVYGWVYGKHGYPVAFERYGEPNENGEWMSDHYGITADLLMLNS